jgi:FlaG/FlaF family flagellin (archaellin)
MRNPVLAIAIAFVLATPCAALAGGKKDTIEVQSPSHQITQPTSGTRVGSPTTKAPTTTPTGGNAPQATTTKHK